MPIIRSLQTAVAASGLPLERGGNSVVGRGRSGPDRLRPTTLLPPRSNGKPEAATSGSSIVGRGRSGPDRSQPTKLLPPRSNGKPEAATAVDKLLMMGMRMPETC